MVVLLQKRDNIDLKRQNVLESLRLRQDPFGQSKSCRAQLRAGAGGGPFLAVHTKDSTLFAKWGCFFPTEGVVFSSCNKLFSVVNMYTKGCETLGFTFLHTS